MYIRDLTTINPNKSPMDGNKANVNSKNVTKLPKGQHNVKASLEFRLDQQHNQAINELDNVATKQQNISYGMHRSWSAELRCCTDHTKRDRSAVVLICMWPRGAITWGKESRLS